MIIFRKNVNIKGVEVEVRLVEEEKPFGRWDWCDKTGKMKHGVVKHKVIRSYSKIINPKLPKSRQEKIRSSLNNGDKNE